MFTMHSELFFCAFFHAKNFVIWKGINLKKGTKMTPLTTPYEFCHNFELFSTSHTGAFSPKLVWFDSFSYQISQKLLEKEGRQPNILILTMPTSRNFLHISIQTWFWKRWSHIGPALFFHFAGAFLHANKVRQGSSGVSPPKNLPGVRHPHDIFTSHGFSADIFTFSR